MRTIILIKPDGVERRLIGEIIGRFEMHGIKIVGLKMLQVNREMAERLYAVHRNKPFFNDLMGHITSSPIVAAVLDIDLKGEDAIRLVRKIVGSTNPIDAEMGSIRGDFGTYITENIVHASDSEESANYEIPIFFDGGELVK